MAVIRYFAKFSILLILSGYFCATAHALTLRTASQSGSEPKYMRKGGRVSGLEVDIIAAVQKADPGIRITSFYNSGHFVAFPKATIPIEVVERVEAALIQVRASGKLGQIIQKYMAADLKPNHRNRP